MDGGGGGGGGDGCGGGETPSMVVGGGRVLRGSGKCKRVGHNAHQCLRFCFYS